MQLEQAENDIMTSEQQLRNTLESKVAATDDKTKAEHQEYIMLLQEKLQCSKEKICYLQMQICKEKEAMEKLKATKQ